LGLSHPFDGGSGDGSTMNLNIDFQRNTVMTYIQRDRNLVVQSDGSYSLVNSSTPGLLDIEAIGAIYGTDGWVHEATDTTYGAGSGSNLFDDSYNSIRVIVDSDGDDTFDASGVTATGSIINLTPGTYSSVGYYATDAEKIAAVAAGNAAIESFLTGVVESQDALASASNSYYTAYERESLYRGQDNVGIAYNTWMENAVGGDGDDTITGNAKGNLITGGAGNDTIDGGAGDDIAVFSGVVGSYTSSTSGGVTTITGTDGIDTLTNIEYLNIGGTTYNLDLTAAAGAAVADAVGYETEVVTGGATYGDGATNVGGLALADIKVETKADSQNAVTVLNRSLEQISSSRAKLGALMNRLQHNIDNQTKSSMMSQQARGRIVDSDMAVESTKLAQEMILSQAAQQAINMATQRQATVLQLLET
jgi:flagellin-like hook-associated protein FlgL